jgi:hypothetical protein
MGIRFRIYDIKSERVNALGSFMVRDEGPSPAILNADDF